MLSLQSCPTLRDPMNCSLPSSSNHGISQASMLESDLAKPGIKPTSLLSSALAGGFFTTSTIWEASPLLRVGNSGWDQPVLQPVSVRITHAFAIRRGGAGSILELGSSPRVRNDKPLQCSCLENSMDTEAWGATVHRVTKNRIQLSD